MTEEPFFVKISFKRFSESAVMMFCGAKTSISRIDFFTRYWPSSSLRKNRFSRSGPTSARMLSG